MDIAIWAVHTPHRDRKAADISSKACTGILVFLSRDLGENKRENQGTLVQERCMRVASQPAANDDSQERLQPHDWVTEHRDVCSIEHLRPGPRPPKAPSRGGSSFPTAATTGRQQQQQQQQQQQTRGLTAPIAAGDHSRRNKRLPYRNISTNISTANGCTYTS